ncbi:NF038122 family metalloprotease [Bradyrhizobium sp. GCM10028915]|uniref:NF038122 family metalloprotease n=1 Tax=Bradyrhizobium sp. GCM10028915 TaxID=3273385 RepID=UPI00361A3325
MPWKLGQFDLFPMSDDPTFNVDGEAISATYIPAGINSGGAISGGLSTGTMAATTGSTETVSSGGLTINLIFDSAAMAASASLRDGIAQAASILASSIIDKITVNLQVDISGTGGGAAAGPDNGLYESYSLVRSDLINNASLGDSIFSALPSGTSIQGQSSVAVWNSQLKLWGLLGANNTTTDDGSATFAADINPNLIVGVALHELTHALGRVPYGTAPDVFDLFRFTSPSVRLFQGGATAPASYFSVDGGSTKLADYGRVSDASDYLNSGVQGPNDPFNEYYTSTTTQVLSAVDLKQLDALGFHLTSSTPVVIEAYGSTSLVQVLSNYFLKPIAGGTGPELSQGGSPAVAGSFGGWAPIGAEQTASGYEVAWKYGTTDQYLIWNADSSGNFTSYQLGLVSGSNASLEAAETSFHQDLNGDGVIGIPVPVTIEAYGSTALVQVANHYLLNPVAGGSGPTLSQGGSPAIAGSFGGWVPIGAEKTGAGYEVAWKYGGADQYLIWSADNSGNFISSQLGLVSGSNASLEASETSFHQDLNGDGVVGVPVTLIEAYGSTELVQVGSNYFLNPVAGGTGPELSQGGSPAVAGSFGGWVPIGAEQTGSGYEVAWKYGSADQYLIWNADSGGNFISYQLGLVSGSNASLESAETSFHQDLNGDGVIGAPVTVSTRVIEAYGSTELVQVGGNYFLNPVAGGTGPELSEGGAPAVAGSFGGWVPIGAEQSGTGYELAWKYRSTDQYLIWNTDSSGNFTSYQLSLVSGSNSALKSAESSFQQDLNGDGTIGVLMTTIVGASNGSSLLTSVFGTAADTSFYFLPAQTYWSRLAAGEPTDKSGFNSAPFQDQFLWQSAASAAPASADHVGPALVDLHLAELHHGTAFIL